MRISQRPAVSESGLSVFDCAADSIDRCYGYADDGKSSDLQFDHFSCGDCAQAGCQLQGSGSIIRFSVCDLLPGRLILSFEMNLPTGASIVIINLMVLIAVTVLNKLRGR